MSNLDMQIECFNAQADDLIESAKDLQEQLTAANARVEALECHWREVDEKPPSNQPILIEMKMPNGETRYDMTMSDLLDNALYVTRWAPAPPEQEEE